MADKKTYIYCEILPSNYTKAYLYISDFDVNPGDIVVIPIRQANTLKVGLVLSKNEYSEQDAPWPPDSTKHILRKFGESEPLELTKQLESVEKEKYVRFKSKYQNDKLTIKDTLFKNRVDVRKRDKGKQTLMEKLDNYILISDSFSELFDGVVLSEDAKSVIGFNKNRISYLKESKIDRFDIRIPTTVERVEDGAFGKNRIGNLYIPKELKYLGKSIDSESYEYTLYDFQSMEVEEGNKNYAWDGTALYSLDGKKKSLLLYTDKSTQTHTASNDVVSYEQNAFKNGPVRKKIVLSENVEEFSEYALPQYHPTVFEFSEIFLPKTVKRLIVQNYRREVIDYNQYEIEGNRTYDRNIISYRVDEENEHLFRDEDSIYEVLEDGTYKLVTCCYDGKGKVLILEGTSIIGENAFKNHKHIDKVELPDSIRTIEKSAFENTNLKSIVFPKSIKHIETRAFHGCNELMKAIFLSAPDYIAYDAFDDSVKIDLPEPLSLDNNLKQLAAYFNQLGVEKSIYDQANNVTRVKCRFKVEEDFDDVVDERLNTVKQLIKEGPLKIVVLRNEWYITTYDGKMIGVLGQLYDWQYSKHPPISSDLAIQNVNVETVQFKKKRKKFRIEGTVTFDIAERIKLKQLAKEDLKIRKQFTYQVNEEEVNLIDFQWDKATKTLVIPACIEGKPVRSVPKVFDSLSFPPSPMEIIISEGIERLEDFSFSFIRFGAGRTIVFPKSLNYISPYAFSYSKNDLPVDILPDLILEAPEDSYADFFLKKAIQEKKITCNFKISIQKKVVNSDVWNEFIFHAM